MLSEYKIIIHIMLAFFFICASVNCYLPQGLYLALYKYIYISSPHSQGSWKCLSTVFVSVVISRNEAICNDVILVDFLPSEGI